MIRAMTLDELKEIYNVHMMNDFPDDERKPLHVLETRYKKKQNICLCYFEQDSLKGYSILEYSEKNRCLLMDYFAVLKLHRSQGAGTRFLHELKEYFREWNAIIIEAEAASDEESGKRLKFYEKCGAFISGVRVNLYFVDYEILTLCLHEKVTAEKTRVYLEEIYAKIYPKPFQKLYLKWK